jgi:transposase
MGRKKKEEITMAIVNPNAAGIDVGSRSHFVAVGQGADDVREFGVYSDDLLALCLWLKEKGVTAVALESTGTYWQNLFVALMDHGLNPILVSGKFTKNVQGKKTDVQDCQYIQKMHTMGLLPASYQPSSEVEQLRQYTRHRQSLIEKDAKSNANDEHPFGHRHIGRDGSERQSHCTGHHRRKDGCKIFGVPCQLQDTKEQRGVGTRPDWHLESGICDGVEAQF